MSEPAIEATIVDEQGAPRAIVKRAPAGEIETAGKAAAMRVRAETEAMYALARQFPRDLDQVRLDIIESCKRPRFAMTARYKVPRAGKFIEGPSIRFAEEVARRLGNVYINCTVSHEDSEVRIIRVVVIDLQSNTPYSDETVISKTMDRRELKPGQVALSQRVNTSGHVVFTVATPNGELLPIEGAAKSKIIRNLLIRILPSDILEEAMDQVVATLKSGDKKDPAGARKALIDSFAAINVQPSQLRDYLGAELAGMTDAQLDDLRGIYVGIKDGQITWKDIATKDEKSDEVVTKLAEKVKANKAAKKAASQPSPPTSTESSAAQPSEVAQSASTNEKPEQKPSDAQSTPASVKVEEDPNPSTAKADAPAVDEDVSKRNTDSLLVMAKIGRSRLAVHDELVKRKVPLDQQYNINAVEFDLLDDFDAWVASQQQQQ